MPNTNKHQDTYIRLIARHQTDMHAYILSLLPQRTGAQDILQETNIVLWKKMEKFEHGTNFKAWAFKIAYFETLAHLKKKRRNNWLKFDEDLLDRLAADAEEDMEDFDIRHGALRGCLSKLSEKDRDIIRNRYERKTTLEQYGNEIGRSVGGLKQALIRIRTTLRKCIERSMIESKSKS